MAAISASGVVAPIDPLKSDIKPFIAGVAISKGQSVTLATTGKLALCKANTAGSEQFLGIALTKAGVGQACDVLMRGPVEGFDLSGVAYGGAVFQADTAGTLDTAKSATKEVRVGRVLPSSDKDLTKILYVHSDWSQVW